MANKTPKRVLVQAVQPTPDPATARSINLPNKPMKGAGKNSKTTKNGKR